MPSILLLPLVIGGCSSGDVPPSIPCVDTPRGISVDYVIHQDLTGPFSNKNWDCVKPSEKLPYSLEDYFGDFGPVCWKPNPDLYRKNFQYRGGVTLQEMKSEWSSMRTYNDMVLVCATGWMFDIFGNLIFGQFGISPDHLPGQPTTSPHLWVFRQTIENSNDFFQLRGRVFDWVVAHELGHVVAGLVHPGDNLQAHAEMDRSYFWCPMFGNPPIYPANSQFPDRSVNLQTITLKKQFCRDESGQDESTCAVYLSTFIAP